jgi:peptide-methionine (R)-S-oxide reductase
MKNHILMLQLVSMTACAQTTEKQINKSKNDSLNAHLTPIQYKVACQGSTEPAFSGEYWNHKEKGVYQCVRCAEPLFSSDSKFDSGTGWPSFTAPLKKEVVGEKEDRSYGMNRTEITCQKCGAHLGHVFDDGPKPSGMRYCVNSASLRFKK